VKNAISKREFFPQSRWEKPGLLLATGMLAATTDFHYSRLFGFLAVLTAILAVLLGRAVTGAVRALARVFFSHFADLLEMRGKVKFQRG